MTKVGLTLIWPWGQPWQHQYNSRELFHWTVSYFHSDPFTCLVHSLLQQRFFFSLSPGHSICSICPHCYLGIVTWEKAAQCNSQESSINSVFFPLWFQAGQQKSITGTIGAPVGGTNNVLFLRFCFNKTESTNITKIRLLNNTNNNARGSL